MEKNITSIAVDAMGGDNAPSEIVKGALRAAAERKDIRIFLTGPEEVIKKELEKEGGAGENVSIIHAPQVITNDEPPVNAIRKKKDSSIVVGLSTIKTGQCDAFVSAGSTGAILAGASVVAGKLKGVMRTPLAPLIPTRTGYCLLTDCGANVDARAAHLVQFAKMGSIYMENIVGVKNPRVGLLNIGAEEEKGNALVKETFPLMRECKDINFIGSVEARDVAEGAADVVVCEAFAGNVLLKTYEGVGQVLISEMKKGMTSTFTGKLGALLIKKPLKRSMKKFTAGEYGAAPMLGLNGLVLKTHGNATSREIYNSILQCITFKEQRISEKIQDALA